MRGLHWENFITNQSFSYLRPFLLADFAGDFPRLPFSSATGTGTGVAGVESGTAASA